MRAAQRSPVAVTRAAKRIVPMHRYTVLTLLASL